ncbi:hypothetical protein GJ496_009674 [Pomphorhynchus laevis]|nr:hypothetical protein GJ496_009674 [Pomphorhynchus laevis]
MPTSNLSVTTETIEKWKACLLRVIDLSSDSEVRLRSSLQPVKPLYHSEYRGNLSALNNTDGRQSNTTEMPSSIVMANKRVVNYNDLVALSKDNTNSIVIKDFTQKLATKKEIKKNLHFD